MSRLQNFLRMLGNSSQASGGSNEEEQKEVDPNTLLMSRAVR